SKLTPEDRMNPARLDSMAIAIPSDTAFRLEAGRLYSFGASQFVFKGLKQHISRQRLKSPKKNEGSDYLILDVTDGKDKERVELRGGKDAIRRRHVFAVNGLSYAVEYGAIRIDLPFSVACRAFQLDR